MTGETEEFFKGKTFINKSLFYCISNFSLICMCNGRLNVGVALENAL